MPAKAKPFDFEKFIKSAQDKPRIRRVKILAADNSDEITRLQDELVGALADEQIQGGDRRMGERPKSASLYAKIKKLQDETAQSGQEFTFRSLTYPEYNYIRNEAVKDDADDEALLYGQLKTQCMSHDLTAEQWAEMATALPVGEFGKLTAAANDVAEEGVEAPKVSDAVLEAMRQKESEQS